MVLSTILARRRAVIAMVAALIVAAALQFTNTNPAVSQTQNLTAIEVGEDPGLDPDAAIWTRVGSVQVPLSAQRSAYIVGGSAKTVRAQAVQHKGRIYMRLAWDDDTNDDATVRVEDFADAAAIEFPADGAASIPSICMGQADAAVNIWHWRADSNAGLLDPTDVYTSASVDGYPSTEPLFYTAREAGNPFANPDLGPVQTLVSRAFGELTTLEEQDVEGFGRYDGSGWAVVFARSFDAPTAGHAAFSTSTTVDLAFAVWDGSEDERNGRKSVSQFVTLYISGAEGLEDGRTNWVAISLAITLLLGVTAVGFGLATYGYRKA